MVRHCLRQTLQLTANDSYAAGNQRHSYNRPKDRHGDSVKAAGAIFPTQPPNGKA